jgi:hypothetical protein
MVLGERIPGSRLVVQVCPEPSNARLEEELVRIEYVKRIVFVNQKEKGGAGGGT